MRSRLLAVSSALTSLAVVLSLAQPSGAASPVPPPWVVASSTTSLTLDWPSASGTGSYRIFFATSYQGVLSGSARSTTATGSKGTIRGLRPGTMYCFQVAKRSGANRSQRYCHPTMRRKNSSSATRVGVATFNVCGHAAGCKSWSKREDAIVSRIRAARADVVNVQEAHSRVDQLALRLKPHGFLLIANAGTEAIFYRPSKLTPVTRTETEWQCTGEGDQEVCGDTPVQVPVTGSFHLGGNATAAWAQLRLKRTQKAYVFVSAHLTSGKGSSSDRARDRETRRLVAKAEAAAGSDRVIYAGDFNSNRSRSNDAPRKRFARHGVTDAYDRSATYSRAYLNSFNGWKTKPNRGVRYGDHVDHVFVKSTFGVSHWAVVAVMRGGHYARPIASDHNLVRATIWLS